MNHTFLTIAPFALTLAGIGHGQTFRKAKMIYAKGAELPVELVFSREGQHFTVKSLTNTVADVPSAGIVKLSYEKAARHRMKDGSVQMFGLMGAGVALMLAKSKNNWFYVDYKATGGATKSLTLKLDESEYRQVLAAATDQTGKQVGTVGALVTGARLIRVSSQFCQPFRSTEPPGRVQTHSAPPKKEQPT